MGSPVFDSILKALSSITCEVATLKVRVEKLEEEKKELMQKLLVNSQLDEGIFNALRSLDNKLTITNRGLEEEANELRSALLTMVGKMGSNSV